MTGRSRLAALGHLSGLAIDIPLLPAALAIQIPQEPLVVTLQLVVEDHALDRHAAFP